MNYWFTSDYHLGHQNIIKYCDRPFKSLLHMNRTIIKNHNERVKKDDIVFHIGDFCFRNTLGGKVGEGVITKSKEWEEQLNGQIIHIQGNHDRNNSTKTIIQKLVIKYGGKKINLVHNPAHSDINYSLNFCGHVHQLWKFKRAEYADKITDIINVGIDVWKFRPVKFEEIMKEYYRWRNNDKVY